MADVRERAAHEPPTPPTREPHVASSTPINSLHPILYSRHKAWRSKDAQNRKYKTIKSATTIIARSRLV
jgi:hypothetical protein